MLDIHDLRVSFREPEGDKEVIHGIDLHMDAGELLGLVGESGSGKSVTALTVAGLLPRSKAKISGEVLFQGENLLECSREALRKIQGRDIGMVFQEPMTSLDPVMKVGRQVEEALRIHTDLSPAERRERAIEMMGRVGLPNPEYSYEKYPHQMSGGQRQRAMIAAALISRPALLLADEPTTALDVTVQAQIIELLKEINRETGTGILFISHDLHVIKKLCTRVAVMYQGSIVETGPTEEVFYHPQDDYTKRLIAAIPTREKRKR